MKILLRVRAGRQSAQSFAADLARRLEKAGGSIVSREGEHADLVVAVGGDGTMLWAVREALERDVPVLGFNLGTLGFLAKAEPSDLESVVHRLVKGEFEVEERLTIEASIGGQIAIGVNDVVVEKIDSTRLVSLEVMIDDDLFTTYRADGLILATPTGSTAYSFSAGGPVIDPGVRAIVLTPVAAHSLFDRPIVIPAASRVTVEVVGDRPVRVNVDKTSLGNLGDGDTVVVSAGERPARFVTFGTTHFPTLVRDKFGLG